ncbi:MAG TPA: flagellar hook-associated protein FlgK [Candidatus Brocadiaceae bacterium]|nr:flagellar hook-associated protein FlgK [Candidatus Brocadiaceae bacterium]
MSSDMQIGMSGLLTAQRAMLVAGHNISNANTKGYTRQTALLAARLPAVTSKGSVGQGVELAKIIRQKDTYLNNRLREIASSVSSTSTKSQYLRELETLFNETTDSGINSAIASFFESVSGLSQDPESISSRAVLLEKANTLSAAFNRIPTELDQMKTFIRQNIESKVEDINTLTANLVDVNMQIYALKIKGLDSNDLLDKQELLLQDISSITDITTQFREDGTVDVSTGGGSLVTGASAIKVYYNEDDNGKITITNSNGMAKYVFNGGEMKGLLDLYNTTVVNYNTKVDTLASNFIGKVNQLHSEGVGLAGGFSTIRASNAVSDVSSALNDAGLPFDMSSGDIYMTVTNTTTGEVTKNKITIDPSSYSLTDVQDAINDSTSGLAGDIAASITDKKLRMVAQSDYQFNFSYALDPNPGSVGTSVASVSGIYTGTANDVYTFTALGAGTIGVTSGLQIEVKNSNGDTVTTLDVGSSYAAGTTLSVADGITLSLADGVIAAGDEFSLDVVSDSDTTDILSALGINTFFSGSDASDIAVNDTISNDVSLIAASTGEVGNNTNALRIAQLQDSTSAVSSTTFADYMHQTTSGLGEEARNAYKLEENYTVMQKSLENRRDEVSGVNMDEEMVNLVRFQQAYDASAKYISMVNELVNRLINSVG